MTAKTIAIDGPAGAGKSTVAKMVAERLGYLYIDTGAMYRSIAYLALKNEVALTDEAALTKLVQESKLELKSGDGSYQVVCNGEDISEVIRLPEVSGVVSPVAAVFGVREALTVQQQALAAQGSVVLDGRDIGTTVLPKADLKVFLTASLTERARRRAEDLAMRGVATDLEKLTQEIKKRDEFDSQRAYAPLKKAEDARFLDSSELSIEEVVEQILSWARESA